MAFADLTSTIISTIAILKIVKTVKLLKKSDPIIRIDNNKFNLHIALLILLTTSVIAYLLPYKWYSTHKVENWFILFSCLAIEFFYQVGLCYIVWKMGTGYELR